MIRDVTTDKDSQWIHTVINSKEGSRELTEAFFLLNPDSCHCSISCVFPLSLVLELFQIASFKKRGMTAQNLGQARDTPEPPLRGVQLQGTWTLKAWFACNMFVVAKVWHGTSWHQA